jgi:RNA polymerase sigma-70 factor, ECF subfamily
MPFDAAHPADLAACSDEHLVELLVAGEKEAMNVIFDRYYAMMMRVALRILHDRGEAEDAVQVAFTDFYRTAKNFSPAKGRLSTWLLQYIYGRSLNRHKGLKSRHYFDHVEFSDVDPSVLARGEEGPFRLSTQEARLLVEQALKLLNEKQRRAVDLICFVGLTIQETAAATGETAGNIQHHYYRGLEKLRAAFEKLERANGEREKGVLSGLRRIGAKPKPLGGEVENAKAPIL